MHCLLVIILLCETVFTVKAMLWQENCAVPQ